MLAVKFETTQKPPKPSTNLPNQLNNPQTNQTTLKLAKSRTNHLQTSQTTHKLAKPPIT